MALETKRLDADSHMRYSSIFRSGTRTAEDFKVDLGFVPLSVTVTNLTDGVSCTWFQHKGNGTNLCVTAAGAVSWEDGGVAMGKQVTDADEGTYLYNRTLEVTVATKGLETDDDEVLIEAWG